MKVKIFQPLLDRAYLISAISALFGSGLVSFLYKRYLYVDSSPFFASMFMPGYIFILVIFAINFTLGYISYNRDRHFSYVFNGLTVVCCLLLSLALILNINNPNG